MTVYSSILEDSIDLNLVKLATYVVLSLCSIVGLENMSSKGWRDGSIVRSISYSYRGPGFDFHHPHGGL